MSIGSFKNVTNKLFAYELYIYLRNSTGLNSGVFFSLTGCHTKAEESSMSYYLPIAERKIIGSISFS